MRRYLHSKLFWAVAVPVALVGLYALVGFKIAPGVVRNQARAFVQEHYGRDLAIGAVAIQPFKLQVEIRDLMLPDADGQALLGFQRLFIDFELASLWNRAFTFREVTVEAPLVHAVVRPDGALNLADLALGEEPQDADAPPPSVWIHHLEVADGRLQFTDQARAEPFARELAEVGFTLDDFRTTSQGGEFDLSARSGADESFAWKGRFALAPVISSQGEFSIGALHMPGVAEFLGDALPFGLSQGTMDLDGSYQLTLGEDIELGIQLPTITLNGLGLRARGADADWVTIPTLTVTDTRVALPAQTVNIAGITVDALAVQAWMSADRSVNLQQLFTPRPQAAAAPEAVAAAGDPADAAPAIDAAEPAPPWSVGIDRVALSNASVSFEDRSASPVRRFEVAPLAVQVTGVSLDLTRALPVQLAATINGQAELGVSGSVTPEPLAAELDVKLSGARMQILQPYVLPVADLTITGGELNVSGKAVLAPAERDGPEVAFAGEVSIDGFRTIDNAIKQDLVNFRRLELQKIRLALAPDSLSIDRVRLQEPYARVIISPEQVVNIAAVLDPEGTAAALAERRAAAAAEADRTPAERRRLERERAAAEKAAAKSRNDAAATPPPPPSAPPADTFPVRVRELRIERGRTNFSDFYIQPNFSADIRQLDGTITGISSARASRATVALAGRLEEFSPVSIEGELQPFAFDSYTDLALKFENIALPIFNPYSGPLAGYNIAKGKLTTDLHYHIEDRRLDAQHKIRIDQLEWGEATATQGEATLPVKFATSLLKDRDGVINLDVPVGGTLDDPSFRVGPIVWQVIKNIIVKAVTAPFALLGSLFEGAEDAQFVDFAPGDAALDAATAERLAALARSLAQKPELKLDVPIGAVADLDRPALAEVAYRVALEGATAARFGSKDGAAPAYASLEPKQRIGALTDLIRQQSGAAPRLPEPPEPPEGTSRDEAKALRETAAIEFLEQTARAGVVVPEVALTQLAQERANAIERALLADAALDPTRVFKVREGKVTLNEGKVRFELGLQ